PIIMLTARDAEIDTVVGLEVGADDYVTKPFRLRELVARIRAALRRAPGEEEDSNAEVVEVADVRLDPIRHEVSVRGEPVQLALKEFDLLELLLVNAVRTDATTIKQGQVQGEPTPICGTGDDTRPAPVSIAKLDQATGQVSGAGSTFVAPLMTFWSNEFDQTQGAQVKYDSVGSGAGVARISAGQVDFGASEAPMTDAELAAAKGGAILHIPLVFGAVVPAYH